MSSRSPSLAFEPTPAIESTEDISSSLDNMKGTHIGVVHNNRGGPSREVHFSPPPARRAQSIATSVPFLDPVSSASPLPRHSRNATPSFDINDYIAQSRVLMEKQRLNFEAERNLWNTERALLQKKIADLESAANKAKNGAIWYSNDSSSAQSLRSDFEHSVSSSNNTSRMPSQSSSAPPVWETPDMSATVTRVFSTDNSQKRASSNTLPSIAEDGSSSAHDRTPSPRFRPVDHAKSVSIPIEEIDGQLDGVTLKSSLLRSSFSGTTPSTRGVGFTLRSTAHPPSFVAKDITPTKASRVRSPSPASKSNEDCLRVKMDRLVSPADEKLILHAGHTPRAMSGGSDRSESEQSTQVPTPKHGTMSPPKRQSPPRASARPPARPSENSDSYFASLNKVDVNQHEKEHDIALREPLALENIHEHGKENGFLAELDVKLLSEAKKHLSPTESSETDKESLKVEAEPDDGFLQLRIKKSTNFGSLYGSKKPGNI